MSTPRAQRSAAIALLLGTLVCVLVALGSALAPPQLVGAGPRIDPPVHTEVVTGAPPSALPEVTMPDLPQPAERLDLGWVVQIVVTLAIIALILALVLGVV